MTDPIIKLAQQAVAVEVARRAPPFAFGTPKKNPYLKSLFYGPIGSGKTHLAGTSAEVPEMRDILDIDAEGGSLTLTPWDDKITTIPINKYSQFARIHEFLRLHVAARDSGDDEKLAALEERITGTLPQRPKKFKTVIVDSLTEVQKYCMYQLTGIHIGDQRLDIDPSTPEFKEWGQNSEMIRLMVRSFRDLPMHIIFIAQEQVGEDERKQQIRRVALPGKLAGEVPGFFDAVGYLGITSDKEGTRTRRLYLAPHPRGLFDAKNRFAGFDDLFIDDPKMSKLLQLARGQKSLA
jgi:hypothetical protein